jgi:hypothetical protein
MPDYSKTVIYKITCNDPEVTDVYVGHTVNFYRRTREHRIACNNDKNKAHHFLVYQTIRNNGGWNNWTMIEVEPFPCADVYEAIAREGYWYKELNGTLNYCVPSRTNKEWFKNNDCRTQYMKAYNKKLKKKMVCDCGSCFNIGAKKRHQQTKKHLDYLNSL